MRQRLLKLYPSKKIEFMIAGAQKARTSGLFGTLAKHPKLIRPIALKEIHYFSNNHWYNQTNLNQYHSFFSNA